MSKAKKSRDTPQAKETGESKTEMASTVSRTQRAFGAHSPLMVGSGKAILKTKI